jgi:predicted secreted protein
MARRFIGGSLALVLGMTLAASAVVAATPAQAAFAAKKNVTLTVTELPAQVRLVPGESVNVRLSTNVTTAYAWSTKVVGKKEAVTVAEGLYTAPGTGLMGTPGSTTWTVAAKAKGTAVIRFLKTPPGGGTKQSDGSLTVIVR